MKKWWKRGFVRMLSETEWRMVRFPRENVLLRQLSEKATGGNVIVRDQGLSDYFLPIRLRRRHERPGKKAAGGGPNRGAAPVVAFL